MSIMTSDFSAADFAAPGTGLLDAAAARVRKLPRGAWALVIFGAIYVGGGELRDAPRSPLAAAAHEMHAPAWQPSNAVLQAVGRHFSRHAATVSAEFMP